MTVLGDRGLRAWLNERGAGAAVMPKITSRTVRAVPFEARATVYTITLSPALVQWLMELEASDWPVSAPSTTLRKAGAKSSKLTLVVVPDGERTVLSFAPDERVALDMVALARGAAPKTLAQVPELSSLRTTSTWSGSFRTVSDVLHSLPLVADNPLVRCRKTRAELLGLAEKLPQGGAHANRVVPRGGAVG
ncbi:MAG: hypothetical protein DIU78_020055 [Pseudomonadota bacterium]